MDSENGHRRGLLVDYGGVLTSSPFASFRQFCAAEGQDENAILARLRSDASVRELVFALETGLLSEQAFEARFGEMLGVAPDALIDRLFAHYEPDQPMLCVFVDDMPVNLDPAAALGMAIVHHVRAEETVAELEALLGVPLR